MRRYTSPGVDPLDAVTYERRDSVISNQDGSVVAATRASVDKLEKALAAQDEERRQLRLPDTRSDFLVFAPFTKRDGTFDFLTVETRPL